MLVTTELQHRGARAGMSTEELVLERLTPLDVSNLRIERRGLPVNVAAARPALPPR
jgi:hypothetical protein